MAESHLRSILKGLSWRFIATSTVTLVAWIVTGDWKVGLSIGGTELVIKLIIYYLNERVWQGILKGKEQTKRISLIKSVIWRFIASGTTFLISIVILKNTAEESSLSTQTALTITAIEFVAKFIFYYLHERAWLKWVPKGTFRKKVK